MKSYAIEISCRKELIQDAYENWIKDLEPDDYDEKTQLLLQIKQKLETEVTAFVQIHTLEEYFNLTDLIRTVTDGEYQIWNGGQYIEMFE